MRKFTGSVLLLRLTLIAALATLGASVLPAASASAAAPAWKLTISSYPTNFAPGSAPAESSVFPQYFIVATNVGTAATGASGTITDTLPDGVTPLAASGVVRGASNSKISCGVSGQTVTCAGIGVVPAGRYAEVEIPVEVDVGAPPNVSNEARISGGDAGQAVARTTTAINFQSAPFGLLQGSAGLSLAATRLDGGPAIQAGSHPAQVTIDVGFSTAVENKTLTSTGHVHNVDVRLPRGMVVNPTATPVRCLEVQLESSSCPPASAVGTVMAQAWGNGTPLAGPSPLYNMLPPPGKAAEFGFEALGLGVYVHLFGGVNSAGEYELYAGSHDTVALELNPITGVQTTLWGNPSDPSHDETRGDCIFSGGSCPVTERSNIPLVTMPSSCRPSLALAASADSWEDTSTKVGRSGQIEDPSTGEPTGTVGCGQLEFHPKIEARPTTSRADSPTGLDFNLHVPQTNKFDVTATANVKDVKAAFPEGVAVNPSSANGLGACTSVQAGLTTPIGQSPIRFNEEPAKCPDSAKIGSVEVNTPALDHPLPGAVYVAKPFDNPFNSFLAVYIAINDPQSGVVAKLAGRTEADASTGQITTTFSENPELPIEDVKVRLFAGSRAVFKSPLVCGAYRTVAAIKPWSAPEGPEATVEDSFATSLAASGAGDCPASEPAAPHTPSFEAGTIIPRGGSYSPFVLRLSREDGSQRLVGIDTTLPRGVVGKLAGLSYCSEGQIAAAKGREAPNLGVLEQQAPSCPATSEVGTVTVGAGAGPTPFYTEGRAYLAGPYKGAPLSFVIITPAVAGPFDLGAVVARVAVYVNTETAEVHAVSDPLPTILQGIPLNVRSIAVKMDRPNFILNPTSCDPMSVRASAIAASGQSAALTSRFQVGGCSALKFAPKLKVSLKGGTRRTKHPSLRGVLTYPKKGLYANVARAQVTLPHSAFLDQAHIKTICTRVQFAADQCPRGSIYGFARAFTPLLDRPVEGPVYLRSSSHELPDLVAALSGQIDVDVVGRIDTGKGGGIRTTFESVPDAPVSKFVLTMQGGKKGLLVNSENICRKKQRVIVDFEAHNGKVHNTTPIIHNSCKGKRVGKKKH